MRSAAMVVLVATVAPAAADPAAADRLADAATALASAGHQAEAADQFRKAFAEDPRPELMCNAAVSYYKAKDPTRARRYLEKCIAGGASLDAAFIANLREVLNVVETDLRASKFAPVEVDVDPQSASITITGDSDEPYGDASHIWLGSGHHELVVRADGYVERKVPVEITDAKLEPIKVKLERVPIAHHEPSEPAVHASTRPAMIASIATAALGVTSVVTYLYARSRASQVIEPNETLTRYDELVATARRWQDVSWGTGIAAGIGVAVSSYLWYRALRTPVRLEVTASGGGASASLAGSW